MKNFKDPITGQLYAYEDDADSFVKDGLIAISDAELEDIKALREAQYRDSLTYAQLRAAAYPSIQDQLDLLYHGGMDAWKAAITAVKEEFPKETT